MKAKQEHPTDLVVESYRQDKLKRWKDEHIVIIGLDERACDRERKKQLDNLINQELGITSDD